MEILMALLYCFHQMFANLPFVSKTLTGNLDLFYALGIIGIIFVIFKRKKDISLLIICALPIAILWYHSRNDYRKFGDAKAFG